METARTEAGHYDEVRKLMKPRRITVDSSRGDGRRSLSELLMANNGTCAEEKPALEALRSTVTDFTQPIAKIMFRSLRFLHYDPKKLRMAAETVRLMSLAGGDEQSMVTSIFLTLIERLKYRKRPEESDREEEDKRGNRIFRKIFNRIFRN